MTKIKNIISSVMTKSLLPLFITIIILLAGVTFLTAQKSTQKNRDKGDSAPQNLRVEPKEKQPDKKGHVDVAKLEKANELYKQGKFEEALKDYSEAGAENPEHNVINYNIGNVLYKTGKMEEAVKKYSSVKDLSEATYNTGNAYYRQQKWQEAMKFYREALIKNPSDRDAKFNYEFVKKKLEEQQKNQQNQENQEQNQDNKDKQQQQNKDKQDQKQDKKDQQDKKNQDKQDKKNQENKNKDQQKKKQDKKQEQGKKNIDPRQAESMLQALREKEKELMKEVKKAVRVKPKKVKKDW